MSYNKLLNLEKHIEGGHFKRVYQSNSLVAPIRAGKQPQTSESRTSLTSIYYLLEDDDYSAWHRIKSDEIWHYYDGNSLVKIHAIKPSGEYRTHLLGSPLRDSTASFQVAIPAGDWFAAELVNASSFALMGCTVAPGFEYADFELADINQLKIQFPVHSEVLERLGSSIFNSMSAQDSRAAPSH